MDGAIKDYNSYFGTSYDTSSDKFQNYYKDLSLRVKNREVDLLIVVNMFLTGFDATTLNTLWVDKKLRQHGLIQAFSRTNRILNSIKTFGNIVCFRNLEKEVNDAISIFGNKDAKGIVLLKSFNDYYYGYDDFVGYKALIERLISLYPLGKKIVGEQAEKEFIKLYNFILKTKNILQAFDNFIGNEKLTPFDFQDYQSIYIDLYEKYRKVASGDAESIEDDLVFEIELVKSVEVNIDYILMLVAKYQEENMKDKEIEVKISKAIDSSPTLRNKKDLILRFIDSININSEIVDEWKIYIEKAKEIELDKIIEEENLNKEETINFVKQSFEVGEIKRFGAVVARILPPTPMFGKDNAAKREIKKEIVIGKLLIFIERFFGL